MADDPTSCRDCGIYITAAKPLVGGFCASCLARRLEQVEADLVRLRRLIAGIDYYHNLADYHD